MSYIKDCDIEVYNAIKAEEKRQKQFQKDMADTFAEDDT